MRLISLAVALALFVPNAAPDPAHAGTGPDLAPAPFSLAPPGTIIKGRRHDGTETELRVDAIGDLSFTYTRLDKEGSQNTSRPFCWAGCNPTRRPVEIDRYREIWPLEVGKSTTFQRKRSDGSAVWIHKLKVVRTETIETALGPLDTFVIEEQARGTGTSRWRGKETFWYAPAIDWWVKVEWSDNQGTKGQWAITAFTPSS